MYRTHGFRSFSSSIRPDVRSRLWLALAAVLIVLAAASSASAAPLTWNSVTADWTIGTNWTPGGPPGAADTAIINAGNAQLNSDTTILGINQTGGTISGTGTLTLTGASTWTGGTHTGAGISQFNGPLAISGTTTKTISGSRVVNAASTDWSGNAGANNTISIASTSVFNNTGTFTDANTFNSTITGGTFNNGGTFNKQSGTTTTVSSVFNNTGTVNVNAGTMLMQAGGTSTGSFALAAGALLEFRNGAHTLNNVTTSGAGTFQISTENVGADATVTVNGGTHTSAFLLSGSTMTGTDTTFQGPVSWTGGTISGAAITTFSNDVAISGPNLKVLVGGRTLNLESTTTWSGNTGNNNNAIRFWNGATINNNGTFNDSNAFDSFLEHNVGSPHNFNNIGTYNKTESTITTVDLGVNFNNTGEVNVNAGTMLMGGGGTSTGVFNIADGAKLEFRNGTHTLNNITTSGAGIFQISTENVGADATVAVNGGTHTTPFLLSGSTMTGSDATFQGLTTWSGGTISGAASTTFSNDVAISGPNLKVLVGGRTLNLESTTTWSGNTANNNNAIRFWNGATINNNGTFNDSNAFNSFIEHNVGGPHNFNNIGTYNKTENTITTFDLGVNFNNTGDVNVNAGTITVANAVDNLGTISTATGTRFASTSGGSDLQNHGILQGTGTYDSATGRAVQNFGQVQPGTATSLGQLLIAGDYAQEAAGLIGFNLASLTEFDTMDVAGNLLLNGTVHVSSLGGYNPGDGDTFTIITFDDGVTDVSDLLGVFSGVTWSGFDPGVSFVALYFDHSVVLSASASPVPLPGGLWLLGTGLAGLMFRRRLMKMRMPAS